MEEEISEEVKQEKNLEKVEDIETLKKELNEARALASANLEGWKRAQADFANYRKRSEQERTEAMIFANANFVLKLLPILDDFERGNCAIPEEFTGAPWMEGIRLIEKKLRTTLEAGGLEPMATVGEAFDPCLHEATLRCPGKEGTVVRELLRGYKFHGRVLRPAGVAVGCGEEEAKGGKEA